MHSFMYKIVKNKGRGYSKVFLPLEVPGPVKKKCKAKLTKLPANRVTLSVPFGCQLLFVKVTYCLEDKIVTLRDLVKLAGEKLKSYNFQSIFFNI
jgi:hypothetical protein